MFSAQGIFSSSGNFGEMGTERNGSFVGHEEDDGSDVGAESGSLDQTQSSIQVAQMNGNGNGEPLWNTPRLKGRIPLTALKFGSPVGNR